jgi:pimeloyl-ACP methyl ester carboxylesterase
MQILELGSGSPLVIVPGLQGRWEYVRPTFEALAQDHRVLTFSLGDEPVSGWTFDQAKDIDAYADHLMAVLANRGIRRAAFCGISFGGLVALRAAARHPKSASALILVSTPGPGWHLRPRHQLYAKLPWLFGPLFLAESPFRLRRELAAALPDIRDRWRFVQMQLRTTIEVPLSLKRMAARALVAASYERAGDCRAVACRTLIVHGEPGLDHVVDAGGTRGYAELIPRSEVVTLERTGHLGSITKPHEFSGIVNRFLLSAIEGSHGTAA